MKCEHYDCSLRTEYGYCKSTACTNFRYNKLKSETLNSMATINVNLGNAHLGRHCQLCNETFDINDEKDPRCICNECALKLSKLIKLIK